MPAAEGERGPHDGVFPLFRYRGGRRQLTVWPDGTLEGQGTTRRTKRVSLVKAQQVSVAHQGGLVIVGRERAFAAQTTVRVHDRVGDTTVVWVRWGMPRSAVARFQQLAQGFGATVEDPLPTPAATEPATRPGWRARVAEASTWVSSIAAFIGLAVLGIMLGSDVASDRTDPVLWAAVLACSCLTATALLTLLEPPPSPGRLGLGLLGLTTAVFIPLQWGVLTGTGHNAAPPGVASAATTTISAATKRQKADELLSYAGPEWEESCNVSNDTPFSNQLVAIDCVPPGPFGFALALYEDEQTMLGQYRLSGPSDTLSSQDSREGCQVGKPSEGTWHSGHDGTGQPVGHLKCYILDGDALLEWTVTEQKIYGLSYRDGHDIKSLYSWWEKNWSNKR